ncbi:MAG: hypothetical protein E6J20_04490 [Chloroflexi bacterium]|nr:MAG: hypothetical protein E6J20_04490 [Chloroflexota bacterium]
MLPHLDTRERGQALRIGIEVTVEDPDVLIAAGDVLLEHHIRLVGRFLEALIRREQLVRILDDGLLEHVRAAVNRL